MEGSYQFIEWSGLQTPSEFLQSSAIEEILPIQFIEWSGLQTPSGFHQSSAKEEILPIH